MQDQGEAFYFIANYHSMTSLTDAAERRQNTLGCRAGFPRVRSRPKKVEFFRQSDVPEVTEIDLAAGVRDPGGDARNAPYVQGQSPPRGDPTSPGLFAYPVLMAADILLYDFDAVPVGRTRNSTSK